MKLLEIFRKHAKMNLAIKVFSMRGGGEGGGCIRNRVNGGDIR